VLEADAGASAWGAWLLRWRAGLALTSARRRELGCQGRFRPGAGAWKPARSDSQHGLASTGQGRCRPGLGKAARWRRSPGQEAGRPSRESERPRREVRMPAQPGGRCPGPAGRRRLPAQPGLLAPAHPGGEDPGPRRGWREEGPAGWGRFSPAGIGRLGPAGGAAALRRPR
jgi:hypothetical protein